MNKWHKRKTHGMGTEPRLASKSRTCVPEWVVAQVEDAQGGQTLQRRRIDNSDAVTREVQVLGVARQPLRHRRQALVRAVHLALNAKASGRTRRAQRRQQQEEQCAHHRWTNRSVELEDGATSAQTSASPARAACARGQEARAAYLIFTMLPHRSRVSLPRA